MKKYLLLIFIIFIFTFNARVSASVTKLYSTDFQRDIESSSEWKACKNYACKKDILDRYWKSNNKRIYYVKYKQDNDDSTSKACVYWSIYYNDSQIDTTDERYMEENDYFKITIEKYKSGGLLNIPISSYQDVRLSFDYITNSSQSLANSYSLEIYLTDSNNIKHGPYHIGDYQFNGYYKRDNIYARGYKIITENLKSAGNITIKKIEILPWGNVPMRNTYPGDWMDGEGNSFIVSAIEMDGYKDENYKNPNIELQSFNEDEIRIKTAQRMYDLATIKWSPSHDMNATRNIGGFRLATDVTYYANQTYYGPPYTQVNRVTPEAFFNALEGDDKKLPYIADKKSDGSDIQSANVMGDDCSESVHWSVSKYLPMIDVNGSMGNVFNRNKTTLLGNLPLDNKKESTRSTYDILYDNYLSQIQSNTIDSTKKSNFDELINRRIKSNNSKMYFLTNTGSDNNYYYSLGYNVAATDLPTGENFTLKVDNLNIASGKNVNVTMKYIIDSNTTYDINSSSINQDNISIKMCNGSNCTTVNRNNITISQTSEIDGQRKLYTSSGSLTSSSKITSINIEPFGGTIPSKLFRLYSIQIDVNNSKYYYSSASVMDTIFNLSNNVNTAKLITNTEIIDNINGTISTSKYYEMFADFLAKQDIYKGYSELIVGDVVSRHRHRIEEGVATGIDTHIRIITGSTHVECLDGTVLLKGVPEGKTLHRIQGSCDDKLGIDSARSYYIRSDINSNITPTTYNSRNGYGGLIIPGQDFVASSTWIPNRQYTDINRLSDLEGKNLDYFLDTKNTFSAAMDASYLPIRFNTYINGQNEKPFVQYENGNTKDNIKSGFKGSIFSNYTITSVNYIIKNFDTNETYSHAPTTL